MDEGFNRWLERKKEERQNEISNINATNSDGNSIERRTNVLESIFHESNNSSNNNNPNRNLNNLASNSFTNQNPLNPNEIDSSEDLESYSELDIELNNLIQSQTVSNILNSERFRSSLEQRLQTSLNQLNNSGLIRAPIVTQSRQLAESIPSVQSSQSVQPSNATININDVIDPNNDPELRALINYQVVSNMLQSAFRTHLENTLWTRYVLRNQNATNRRSTQNNNVEFNRQRSMNISANIEHANMLHSMRNEISEMKSMIRIMLQSQIETQRFLRQEMAVVFSSAAKDSEIRNNYDGLNSCIICMNSQSDSLLYRCGHLCLCYPCSIQFRLNANGGAMNCPVCRAEVQEIIRVFTSPTN